MENFISRLTKFMEAIGVNDNQFTNAVGLSNGLIGKAKAKGKTLSLSNIEKILYAYPQLSAEWLMRGVGKMIIEEDSKIAENKESDEIPPQHDFSYKILLDMIDKKENLIREQCELIGRLKEMVGKQEEKYAESSFSSLENAVENVL